MPCSVQALHAFHCNIENLVHITPPHTCVRVLQLPHTIEAGQMLSLNIRRMGITVRWDLLFERVDEEAIIDVAVHSPFEYFRHQHRFIAIGANHTMLKDTVELRMFRGWLGALVHPFIKRDLYAMFAYRHAMTQALLRTI